MLEDQTEIPDSASKASSPLMEDVACNVVDDLETQAPEHDFTADCNEVTILKGYEFLSS